MHGPEIVGNANRRPGGHLEWLKRYPGPIYQHKPLPELPNAVEYPLAAVAQTIGSNLYRLDGEGNVTSAVDEPYLTSSIAQELALAIHEGYEEIWLVGVDLNTDSEYAWQKPGVEYMLGLAAGRGIKVVLPDNCPLLTGGIYGRGYLAPEGERMSLEQLDARMKALNKERAEVARQYNELTGAKREVEFVQAQMVPGIDHEQLDQRRQKMEHHSATLQGRLLQIEGSIKETAYWIHQTPNGQAPRQAVEQYRNLHDSDGPVTELDALQYEEPKPAGEAVTAPVGEFEPAIV